MVRDSEAELVPPITYLINKSIEDGTVPAFWKVACVTPLYKSERNYWLRIIDPFCVAGVKQNYGKGGTQTNECLP